MSELDTYEGLIYDRLTGVSKPRLSIVVLVRLLKKIVHNSPMLLKKMQDEFTYHFGNDWLPK